MYSQQWQCHECGKVSLSYAAAERHSRAEAHHRIDLHTFPDPPRAGAAE